jgi:hypothetical protein
MENKNSIVSLWKEHNESSFPIKLKCKDFNGIDFITLDSTIAGCISTFIKNGNLNNQKTAILGMCYRDTNYVIPFLEKEEAIYFERLEKLSKIILKKIASCKSMT